MLADLVAITAGLRAPLDCCTSSAAATAAAAAGVVLAVTLAGKACTAVCQAGNDSARPKGCLLSGALPPPPPPPPAWLLKASSSPAERSGLSDQDSTSESGSL